MIKLRHAGYCNLKLFLLFLVVYGHWIEPQIGSSPIILTQYRWIYLFHMPLFSFLSGLFCRERKDCLRQIKRCLPMYGICQLAACMLCDGAVKFWTPWWHLWYLLSYCVWAVFGWLWFRFGKGRGGVLILVVSVLLGALAGYAPWLNRTFSGSRTVVFFPYFWAGLICPPDIPWQKYRRWGLVALALGGGAVMAWGSRIPVSFLYHAAPYGSVENGFMLRLLCYGLGFLLGFFVLTAIPARRLPFTRMGADTMPGYLLHGPVVRTLREMDIHWGLCALLSAAFLYILYKTLQWISPMYGIVPEERRDRPWPGFRRSTKNTVSRYTDSSCP